MSKLPNYLSLLLTRVKSELKLNIANTWLGYIWWFLDPLMLMVIYYFVVHLILGRGGDDFHIFILIGILIWQWFSKSVGLAVNCFKRNKAILLAHRLPYSIFVISPVITNALLFFIGIILIGVLFSSVALKAWGILLFITSCTAAFIFAISIFSALIGVVFQEFHRFLDYILKALFFLSPVIYSSDLIKESTKFSDALKEVYFLNPLAIIIPAFRDVLMYENVLIDSRFYIIAIISLVMLLVGIFILKRSKNLVSQSL